MDTAALISLLQESIFVILAFLAFFFYALIRGRQSITNLIFGLYLALLLTLTFPYFDQLFENLGSAHNEAFLMIGVFIFFTFLSTLLFTHIMPREYGETAFEGFGKKLLLALAGTILVVACSYYALPVAEIVNLGSPIQNLFADESRFFWWLIIPLIALMFT